MVGSARSPLRGQTLTSLWIARSAAAAGIDNMMPLSFSGTTSRSGLATRPAA
jgi:hypothetical protein